MLQMRNKSKRAVSTVELLSKDENQSLIRAVITDTSTRPLSPSCRIHAEDNDGATCGRSVFTSIDYRIGIESNMLSR